MPQEALLRRYRGGGHLADCFGTEIPCVVDLPGYAGAFLTSPLFELELWLIGKLARKPSTAAQAWQLARGQGDRLAVWHVEAREANQLLLCDLSGQTRTWMMVAPGSEQGRTQLWFGSGVIARSAGPGEPARIGWGFRALGSFHVLYSRMLLQAAADKLDP